MMNRILSSLLLLFLVSCTTREPQDLTTQTPDAFTSIINTSLTLEPSERLGYLQAHLGQPEHVSEQAVTNLHVREQTDALRSLRYAGVSLTTYLVSTTGEEHLLAIEVRTPHYVTPYGSRIGMSLSELRNDLPVVWQAPESVTYLLLHPDGAPNTLTLWHDEEAVTLITWEFYLG